MAQKRRRKRSWLKTLLFLICTPIVIWFLAFLIWFYWNDITKLLSANKETTQPTPKVTRPAQSPGKKPANEKILEEDRKQLDEILKKRGG